jgi:hypothetical protein
MPLAREIAENQIAHPPGPFEAPCAAVAWKRSASHNLFPFLVGGGSHRTWFAKIFFFPLFFRRMEENGLRVCRKLQNDSADHRPLRNDCTVCKFISMGAVCVAGVQISRACLWSVDLRDRHCTNLRATRPDNVVRAFE